MMNTKVINIIFDLYYNDTVVVFDILFYIGKYMLFESRKKYAINNESYNNNK